MCIRINGDINDVAEMYLDNELRSIKSFLEEVLDLPGRPTISELLGAVKHELHEDEEVAAKEKSVFFVSHPTYTVEFSTEFEARKFMETVAAPFGFYKLFRFDGRHMRYMGKHSNAA